jgi:hypothetical protein
VARPIAPAYRSAFRLGAQHIAAAVAVDLARYSAPAELLEKFLMLTHRQSTSGISKTPPGPSRQVSPGRGSSALGIAKV